MTAQGIRTKPKPTRRKPALFIALSTVPALMLTVYCTLVPAIRALVLSFTDSTSMNASATTRFIALENYAYMFRDKRFMQAMRNTGLLMLAVPVITLAVSLLLATLLTQTKLRERGLYRTVFFFPSIVSMTVVGIVWSFVFHPSLGILNTLLKSIGLGAAARPWLGDRSFALWCVAAALIWQAAGYYMVMHIAAMDGISPEIYESATIDGATAPRKFFAITLPMIWDILGITYVLSLSGTINLSFVLASVMTNGGPNGASSVVLQYMYQQGMASANYGYAMAIAVLTLAVSVLLSGASRWLTGRRGEGA